VKTIFLLSSNSFVLQVLAFVVCHLFGRSLSSPLIVKISAVLRGAFLLFSTVSLELLLSSARSGLGSPVEYLRPLITSGNPNDQYLFLACLECVDPAVWSGNSPGISAVLGPSEVERVMQLLESADALIRRTVSVIRAIIIVLNTLRHSNS
jgi:hypothetical protein